MGMYMLNIGSCLLDKIFRDLSHGPDEPVLQQDISLYN